MWRCAGYSSTTARRPGRTVDQGGDLLVEVRRVGAGIGMADTQRRPPFGFALRLEPAGVDGGEGVPTRTDARRLR